MTDRTNKKTLPPAKKFDGAAKSTDVPSSDNCRATHAQDTDLSPKPSAPSADPSAGDDSKRLKKERRRRIDPTTFEKQYSDDEIEFMNAIQRFKMQSGRSFPTYGEILKVAQQLGYRKEFAERLCQAVDSPAPVAKPV